MATFYVDYEGGNDASDGLSFANRKKRLQGILASELTPGDTIRFIAAPRQYLMNVVSTWTFRSPNVTMNTAVTALVDDGDVAWTQSTDVTATRNSTTYRFSANAAQIVFATGFTTGLAAYYALGATQDYSSYQGLTFWFRTDTVIAANTLSIRLCSDTAGATTVDTFPIPPINALSCWVPIYVDKGSALGASIQSVALYADADPGTATVLLDNINTVQSVASNNNLNLTSVISRENTSANDEGWWPIRGISGNTITFDYAPNMTPSGVHRGYPGNTAVNVAIYKSDTTQVILDLKANNFSGSNQYLLDSGNTTHYITLSGGWNRTDMSTQTGETWFDGMTGYGTLFNTNSYGYINMDRIHAVRGGYGLYIYSSPFNLGNAYATGCGGTPFYVYQAGRMTANAIIVTSSCPESFAGSGVYLGGAYVGTPPRSEINKVVSYCMGTTSAIFNYGVDLGSGTIYNLNVTKILAHHAYAGFRNLNQLQWSRFQYIRADWNDTIGVNLAPPSGSPTEYTQFDYIEANYNGGSDGQVLLGYNFGRHNTIGSIYSNHARGFIAGVILYGPTGTEGVIQSISTSNCQYSIMGFAVTGKWTVLNTSLHTAPNFILANSLHGELVLRNYNGVVGDHRTYVNTVGTIFSNTSVRHTASGLSWRFSPLNTTYIGEYTPLHKKIGAVAVSGNTQVTMSLWVYRDNTGIVSQLVVPGGQIDGVSANVVATAAGTINTWEQLSLNFTPTRSGTVEVYFQCHGGTSYNVLIDDFSVSQV